MKRTFLLSIFLTLAIWSTAQVDQYKVRARLFLQTDSFLIWRGDTIDFNELVSLQQLIDSLNNYANQNLSSTKAGNNVAVNITGGNGTSFSIADGDSVATNEIQNLSRTKAGNYVSLGISSGTGTGFSIADADSVATNEIQNLSRTKAGNYVSLGISSGTGTGFSVADADSVATNEIQNLTRTKTGNYVTLGISSGTGTGFSVADADSSITNEIELPTQTGNSGKFLSTNGTSPSWATALTAEVDGSTSNEIQNLSKSKTGNNVTVNISGGTGTTFTVADGDSVATNEIQNLSRTKAGNYVTLGISSGTGTGFSVADADSSITNEIQNLSYNTTDGSVGISGGTGFTLPNFSTSGANPGLVVGSSGNTAKFLRGDNTWQTVITTEVDGSTTNELENWGTEYVMTKDSSLRGRGTIASPLYIDTSKIATQFDLTAIINPWIADASGINYTTGNVGIGIASQANNALNVKDSVGSYNPAVIIENKHAQGSGLTINIPSATNSYHIARLRANNTEIFNFEGDGSIIMRETSGDLPDSNYGSLYGSTDGKIYYRNDDGGVYDLTLGASGSATPPGGSSGDIQYNNSGAFGGFGDWNGSTLTIPGELAISSSFTTTSAQPVGISSSGYISLYNITAPSAPGSTTGRLYMDSGDDKLYFKNSATTYDLTAAATSGMSNPMTSTGDMIYSSSGTIPARLGIGTTGQVLTVSGGLPSWQNAASGFADPMTTRGDIIIRNSSNTTARLGIGSAGQVLSSNGTDVSWATPSSGFADPMTTRGDIIFRNSSNTTARLGRGSTGQVLTSDGTDIAWATPSGSPHDAVTLGTANGLSLSTQQLSMGLSSASTTGALSSTNWSTFNGKLGNVLTTTGDIIYSSSGTTAARLGAGSSGQVLTIDGGLPTWKTPSTGFYTIKTDSVQNSSSIAYTMYNLSSSNVSYIGMAAFEITTTANAHYGYVYMIVSGAYNGGSYQTNYTILVNSPGSGVSVDTSLVGSYITANIYNSSGSTKKFRLMIMPYF